MVWRDHLVRVRLSLAPPRRSRSKSRSRSPSPSMKTKRSRSKSRSKSPKSSSSSSSSHGKGKKRARTKSPSPIPILPLMPPSSAPRGAAYYHFAKTSLRHPPLTGGMGKQFDATPYMRWHLRHPNPEVKKKAGWLRRELLNGRAVADPVLIHENGAISTIVLDKGTPQPFMPPMENDLKNSDVLQDAAIRGLNPTKLKQEMKRGIGQPLYLPVVTHVRSSKPSTSKG